MKLYLDDNWNLPAGYDVLVRDAKSCIDLLKAGIITHISLDHDLGAEMTGYDVAKFIEKSAFKKSIPRLKWKVHSTNFKAAKQMTIALESADRFWKSKGNLKQKML